MKQLLAILALCLPSLAWAQTANLWIDTNGGTCTRQSTAGAYVDAQACASMSAAVTACTAGDTIRMKAGTYGAQTINVAKTSPGCTIIAETTTNIGTLTTNGAWFEIQNINGVSGAQWSVSGGSNITCRNCNFSGNTTGFNGPVTWSGGFSNISWIGGSLKNWAANGQDGAMHLENSGSFGLIDGITFDNITNPAGPSQHLEVIRIDGNITDLTIRNSTFTNSCASTSTIFMSNFLGQRPERLTFENNFFGPMTSGFPTCSNLAFQENMQGSSNCQHWHFNYNTFRSGAAAISDGDCPSRVDVTWVGNISPNMDCAGGSSFISNVYYGGSTCNASDHVVSQASLNFDTDGFHILTGSSAIDAGGTGANCIATDHDGNSRSSPCDAGAHEFGAGGGSPPSAPGNFHTTWLLNMMGWWF